MKRLALILILPLAFACKTQKDATDASAEDAIEIVEESSGDDGSVTISTNAEEAVDDSYTKPEKPERIKAILGDVNRKTDYYSIISAEIEGVLLFMTVEYSGGCARHSFEFVGSQAISKSLPPQRAVQLMHDNGDDMCESIVRRDIEIDISELAYQQTAGSEIILNLEGYDKPLKFVFP
ncbi:MAG: hypothetical protein Crog4KO_00330 [Crocinitomicaceae bacterium]